MKAKEEPELRFHALIDKVWREDFLTEAWKQVRRNGGAAGVDGESFEDIESYGVDRWLGELVRDLRDGTYVVLAYETCNPLSTFTIVEAVWLFFSRAI